MVSFRPTLTPQQEGNMSRQTTPECKVEKIPIAGYPKKREKALNRMAEKGWRLVEVKGGPLLRGYDLATFERA